MMNTRIQTANYTRIKRDYLSDSIEETIAALENKGHSIEHNCKIADLNLQLKFYTPALAEHFQRAFAHLPPSLKTDLTVYVWDSASTGIALTPPWKDPRHFSLETNVRQASDDGFVGVYSHYDDSMTLYDPANKRAYFWTYDAAKIPVWISAAPLRTLLQWALGARDIHLIHGAVVGEAGKAVLLTAKGGSGKSTTSLACLREGMTYLADDYVAVSRETPPTAYSLYNSVKVAPYHGNDFDPAHVWTTEGQKSVVFLYPLFPTQMEYAAPLSAVLIPEITHQERTEIVPASKSKAMLALIPTTLFQLPLAESTKMQALSSIIGALPCYSLRLGRDSAEAARAVKDFLQKPI